MGRLSKPKSSNISLAILKAIGVPPPVAEYKFCADRRWKVDYAWLDVQLIVEIEGGVWIGARKKKDGSYSKWSGGRHNHPVGYIKDMEKYNKMAELDWVKLSYQPNKVDYDQIKKVYERLKNNADLQ
jgi:hypothetical protein